MALAFTCRDTASELVKRPVGLATRSHGGRTACRRKGLLDEIPYSMLIRGAVIVWTEDAGRVVGLLQESGAELHARTVTLTREDRESLGV